MSCAEIFTKIFCINLDRSPERWTTCCDLFLQHNLNVTRFPAIEGKTLSITELIREKIITENCSEKNKSGAMGVLMSNVMIWREIITHKYPWTLILEDDINFPPDFNQIFREHWELVPKDAELVYLGCISPLLTHGNNTEEETLFPYVDILNEKLVRVKQNLQGAHAYALSYEGAEKLLNKYLPISRALDYFPCSILNIYAFRRIPHLPIDFYLNKGIWSDSVYANLHGIVAVRDEKSTILHINYVLFKQAIDRKNQKDFSGSLNLLIKAINNGGNEPEIWDELLTVAYYTEEKQVGVIAFCQIMEQQRIGKFAEYLQTHRDRIMNNFAFYTNVIPVAKEIYNHLNNEIVGFVI